MGFLEKLSLKWQLTLKVKKIKKFGYVENPCASETDDLKCFYGMCHTWLGPYFTPRSSSQSGGTKLLLLMYNVGSCEYSAINTIKGWKKLDLTFCIFLIREIWFLSGNLKNKFLAAMSVTHFDVGKAFNDPSLISHFQGIYKMYGSRSSLLLSHCEWKVLSGLVAIIWWTAPWLWKWRWRLWWPNKGPIPFTPFC